VEYRRITTDEVPAVAAYAMEGMRLDLYPALRVSTIKVQFVTQHFAQSLQDFHLVAFDRGRIAGAIAAAVQEPLFFDRAEAHVVMCRATVPGAGRALIAALRKWADGAVAVRRVIFPQEFHADPRALRLLHRYGFTQQVVSCVFNKE
jgi:hypothetical protein